MSTRFTVRHTFEVDVDRYWRDIFFDPEFNRRLYTEALGFGVYEVVSQETAPDGGVSRVLRLEPPFKVPTPARPLFPEGLGYTEHGRFDPGARRWRYTMKPKVFADRIASSGTYWVEPRGPARLERVVEVVIEVKALGVGGFIESFIEKLTRESYDKVAVFTNRYLTDRPK